MFQFSSRTEVNKVFKLTDLFRQMGASKEVKKDAACIDKVVLKNVLSPNTLHCEADKDIKEIYVFEITVSSRYVPEIFIKELDNSIKLHTLFNVRNVGYELSMISYKLGNEKGKYYTTNWEEDFVLPVPPINSVPELYKFILSKFLKYPPLESEIVGEYIRRYNQIVKLDFQIGKTTAAIAKESQSKKKFEYNARLKEYKEERERLLQE
jgi:hypothetical protein